MVLESNASALSENNHSDSSYEDVFEAMSELEDMNIYVCRENENVTDNILFLRIYLNVRIALTYIKNIFSKRVTAPRIMAAGISCQQSVIRSAVCVIVCFTSIGPYS